jgi:hypothetical protein
MSLINRKHTRQFLLDHANMHKPPLANGENRFTSVSATAFENIESHYRTLLRRYAERQCSKGRTIK